VDNKGIETVALDTLARGGVMERFEDAIRLATENILDPNTTLAKREINIRVILKPNEARDFCDCQIHMNTKLAAPKPLTTQVYVGMDPQLGAISMEHNPEQLKMGFGLGNKAAEKIAAGLTAGAAEKGAGE
jgi:hypothetical protein